MPHRTRRASPQLQLDPTWTTKHTATLRLAEAYDAIGLPSNGARCRTCGIGILYLESPAHGRQSLAAAHFCRDRLCPTCSWRRSRRLSAQADNVLRAATAAHPSRSFVLLTLTQRNVPGEALPLEISRILTGWRLLTRKTEFSEIAGWFRSVEITYNENDRSWHPHIHSLLWTRPSYWGRGYVSHARWVLAWRTALSLTYDPVIDVHRVRPRRNGDPLGAAAREVAKYTVKDSDLLTGEDVPYRVKSLHDALAGRRLTAWGGELRHVAHLNRAPPPRDRSHCSDCGSALESHSYAWVAGDSAYFRVPEYSPS